MNLIKISTLLLLSLLVTACGSYSPQFDCPIGPGLKCASLSQVNNKIDDGGWPADSGVNSGGTSCPKVYWRDDLTPKSGKGH